MMRAPNYPITPNGNETMCAYRQLSMAHATNNFQFVAVATPSLSFQSLETSVHNWCSRFDAKSSSQSGDENNNKVSHQY